MSRPNVKLIKMSHQFVVITLADNQNTEFKLSYKVRSHEVGQIWLNALQKASTSGLKDTERFYNFSGEDNRNISDYVLKLNNVVAELKKIHPQLIFPSLDLSNIESSVNNLHQNFAHSHLVESLINHENEKLWHRFNVILHAIESCIYSEDSQRTTSFPNARIVFTWNEAYKTAIPSHLYSEYDLDFSFGTAYFAYSQVGRQLFEVYRAGDASLPSSHIQPSRFFSADTLLWFGGNTGNWAKNQLNEKIKTWFESNLEVFKGLSLSWGDPKLSLGQVPVARLIDIPYSDKEKLDLIKKISKFNRIIKVDFE